MKKIKKRLLSCLLLVMGGLSSGAEVSNAQQKDGTITSDISSENSKRNSKVSNILISRNVIDTLGLLIMFFGGKKLMDENKLIKESIEELNDKNSFYEQKIDDIKFLQDFQRFFYFCFYQSRFGFMQCLKDFKEEDFKKYEIVCINNAKDGQLSEENFSYYFIFELSVNKSDIGLPLSCFLSGDFMSVIARTKADNICKDYSNEYGNLSPFKVARYSISEERQDEYVKCAKIAKLKLISLGIGVGDQDLYFGGGDMFEEHKEKFKDYYIIFEIYIDKSGEYSDKVYCKASLVKPKNQTN